jgi:hypothetical protein
MSDDAANEKRARQEAHWELLEQAQAASARSVLAGEATYLDRMAEDRAELVARTRVHNETGPRHAAWIAAMDRNAAALERIAAAIEGRAVTPRPTTLPGEGSREPVHPSRQDKTLCGRCGMRHMDHFGSIERYLCRDGSGTFMAWEPR